MSFTTTFLAALTTLFHYFLTTITLAAKVIFAIFTITITLHHFVGVVLHANTITYVMLLDQSEVEYTTPLRPRQEDDLCHVFDQMAIESPEEFWEQCRLRIEFGERRRAREEFWDSEKKGAEEKFRRRGESLRKREELERKGWKVWGLELVGKKVGYCPNGEFGMMDW